MKRKLSTKQKLLLFLIVETIFLSFVTYQVISSFFPGNKTFKANSYWRPNPTWKGGLNTRYRLAKDFSWQNVSYPNLNLVAMQDNVAYWVNQTVGSDAEVDIVKWFEDDTTEFFYSSSGAYTSQVYVGSKGEPSNVIGASSWSYASDVVTFSVASPQTVALFWTSYNYVFHGLYNETTGFFIPNGVNVTAYFTDGTSPDTFEVNGTATQGFSSKPEYFTFTFPSITNVISQYASDLIVYNQSSYRDVLFLQYEEDTNYEVGVTFTWNSTYTITNKATTGFRVNFGTPPSTDEYLSWHVYRAGVVSQQRQYWLSEDEDNAVIYIFSDNLTTYNINFLDLVGALDDYPYVYAQYYINGTLRTVEKRRVDEEKKIQMSLVNGRKYRLIIIDGSSYTFGDMLMTSTTSITLTLRGIDFPKETLLTYKYVRIYGLRAFATPNGNITITYEDTLNTTNSVDIYINYRNGTNAYNSTETADSFIHVWASALNNTDYQVIATIDHQRYGVYDWRQYFPRTHTDNPWDSLAFLGTLPFGLSDLIGIIFVVLIGGGFSEVNPEIAAFFATVTAAALTYIGFMSVAPGALITAITFSIMLALVMKKRMVGYR